MLLALAGLAATVLLAAALAPPVQGERKQRGEVIVSLDGGVSPLRLPRERPAPIAVRLDGTLRTADGSTLPRIGRVEIGLPAEARISTADLPACSPRQLRNRKPPDALAVCRPAQVGSGRLSAQVQLPGQTAFTVRARLLLFYGRTAAGGRAVLLHAYAARPPTVVVVPFAFRRIGGRLRTALVAELPPALGPWPRLASYEMTLHRRYRDRQGRRRSFLSASCPVPPRFTAGFITFARTTYTLEDGREVPVEIVRGCRARD